MNGWGRDGWVERKMGRWMDGEEWMVDDREGGMMNGWGRDGWVERKMGRWMDGEEWMVG